MSVVLGSDLDACFEKVKPSVALYRHVEDIALPAFVKTSGGTGIHVMIPLGGLCTYDQCTQLGQLLATAHLALDSARPHLAPTGAVPPHAFAPPTRVRCR